MNNKLETISNLFEDKEIRSIWDNEREEYYFSVVDVISVLTNSNILRNYWSDLKRKLSKEGSQLHENIVQLKMKSKKDGKNYLTDTLDTKGILRLIESVPSPKAEPFKIWLASLGSERIDEVFDPKIATRDIAREEHPQGLKEGDLMTNFTWNNCTVPRNLKIKQVYGIVFSNDKRILLRFEDNKYKLTGGKPQANESYEETLKREYIEELNIELEDIHYLGYLLVDEDNIEPYAQVRMIGKIKSIHKNHPDIDNGKQYKRFFSSINNVKKYLNYKDKAGNLLIDDAIIMVNKKYKFDKISDIENFV